MKTTQSLEDIVCSKCKQRGQLKLRYGKYYEVHHYKFHNGFRHGTYVSCCYIGKLAPKETGNGKGTHI